MFTQHTLRSPYGARKRGKSIGRGDGSGHGSYSGKGCKGQSARSGGKVKPGFEGGQTPLIRRLPKLKGFKNINRVVFQAVNVETLNIFEDGEVVDFVKLYEKNLISHKLRPIKILGDGELTKKLTLRVDATSASAKKKIEDKGGTLQLPEKSAASKN